MKKRKIGVMSGCFNLGDKPGVLKAAEVGLDGFQIFCTVGEMAPWNMTPDDRRAFRDLFESRGLELASLCSDFGQHFFNAETNPESLKNNKQCVDLALDLGTKVLTSHIGTVPENESDPKWAVGRDALTELSAYAAERGVFYACETGPEAPERLKRFLDQIQTGGIGVNYDPANLVMGGYDHLGGVELLKDYIVHTHAKDGVLRDGKAQEVPLGDGDVNFPEYIARLDAIGYDGYLVIERETGSDPAGDILKALDFLRTL